MQVAGAATGALIVKGVATVAGPVLAGTTVAAAAPFVAAGASVVAVAYGVDQTSTRMGGAVVAFQQRHMASTQKSQLNALLGGDYLEINAQSIDSLLAVKAQMDAARSELLASKSVAEANLNDAEAAYQQLLQLKSQLVPADDPASSANISQTDTLRADASRLAGLCEQMADGVVAQVDGVNAQIANTDAAEQRQLVETVYSKCLAEVRAIHAQAGQMVSKRDELTTFVSSVEARQQSLSQLQDAVGRIGRLADWSEANASRGPKQAADNSVVTATIRQPVGKGPSQPVAAVGHPRYTGRA